MTQHKIKNNPVPAAIWSTTWKKTFNKTAIKVVLR
jgi:hypothetical protein